MKLKLIMVTVAASLVAIGGIAIAQDDDAGDKQRHHKSGFMLDRAAKTLDLDESQQAAFLTFTEVVRAQFPDRPGRHSVETTEDRQAAREAWQAEKQAREDRLEEILLNPEFDVEAFKKLKGEGADGREEQLTERKAKQEEFRAGADERMDTILAAYAEFHRTLNDEQRQKLVWLSEQRGGGFLSGFGSPSMGGHGKGGPGHSGRGDRRFIR
jgi:hypothetical protein